LASTAFGDELMEARHEFATDVAAAAGERALRGIRAFVDQHCAASARDAAGVLELLTLAPTGLKGDGPSPVTYRHGSPRSPTQGLHFSRTALL